MAGVLWAGFALSEVFNPLLLGLLFAYILNPLVEKLEERGVKRGLAVGVIFGAVLVLMISTFSFATLKAAVHLSELSGKLVGEQVLDTLDPHDDELLRYYRNPKGARPASLSDVASIVSAGGEIFVDLDGDGTRKIGMAEQITVFLLRKFGDPLNVGLDLSKLARAYESHASKLVSVGVGVSRSMRRSLTSIGHFFSYVLLVPVYTFFLALYFSSIRDGMRNHLPGAYREDIVKIASKIDVQVAAFFRGKLAVALLKGVVTWIGLWLAGVPFSFFIGMGAGVLSIVPFIGPLIGGVSAVVLCYTPEGWLLKILWVALAFAAAEAAEAVAQPVILGEAVGLSPLTLILSLFVFGNLFGFFGVLLAVPIACVFKTLFTDLVLPQIRALAEDSADPLGGVLGTTQVVQRADMPPSIPTFGS
jgi:predicted PurR-regulated permease PerM